MSRYSYIMLFIVILGSAISAQGCSSCGNKKGPAGDLAHCDGSILKEEETSDDASDNLDLDTSKISIPSEIEIVNGDSTFKIFQTEVTNDQYASFLKEKGAKPDDSEDKGTNDCHLDSEKVSLCYQFTGAGVNITTTSGGTSVTVAGGAAIIDETSYSTVPSSSGSLPVTFVSYHGAKVYCEVMGWRLPSRSEWEVAAGTGTYPWGEDAPGTDCNYANFSKGSNNYCQDGGLVGVTEAPFSGSTITFANGLNHMAGNVYEWTSANVKDDSVDDADEDRYVKGGAWDSDAESLKIASEKSLSPTITQHNLGFRCVK